MMNAAAGIFLAARRKPKLPYDAEVEYLESTGTQYIDTGVPIYYTSSIDIRFAATANSAAYFFGDSISVVGIVGYFFRIMRLANGTVQVQVGNGAVAATSAATTTGVFCNLLISDKKCYLDSVQFGSITASDNAVEKTAAAYLFAYNRSPMLYGSMKVSSCKISAADGTVLRDFIPVRFTNELTQREGAMYDRLGVGGMNPDGSPRTDGLYRNRGTGAFTIGPDKTA